MCWRNDKGRTIAKSRYFTVARRGQWWHTLCLTPVWKVPILAISSASCFLFLCLLRQSLI
jgi:hypothetical protein